MSHGNLYDVYAVYSWGHDSGESSFILWSVLSAIIILIAVYSTHLNNSFCI